MIHQADRRKAWVRDVLPQARARLEDPRDQALLTELAYGTLRRLGTIDRVLEVVGRRPLPRVSAVVRTALRLGLYQILFLDRVPPHAVVDQAVTWTREHGSARATG